MFSKKHKILGDYSTQFYSFTVLIFIFYIYKYPHRSVTFWHLLVTKIYIGGAPTTNGGGELGLKTP